MEQLLNDLTAELAVIMRLAPQPEIASYPKGNASPSATDDRELLYALAATAKTLAALVAALDGRVTALE